MACFLVSAAEAAVVKVVERAEAKKEEGKQEKSLKVPLSRKLKWLTWMLTGGAVLLLFEHIWHGEVVPWFPFLTAMNSAGDTSAMLREVATTGVCMAAVVTVAWIVMCVCADAIVRRRAAEGSAE